MDNVKNTLQEKISKYNKTKKIIIITFYVFSLLTIVFAIYNFLKVEKLVFNYVLLLCDFILFTIYLSLTKNAKKYYNKISTEYEYLYRTDENFIKSELTEIYKISNNNKTLIFSFFISVILMIISLII